MGITNDQHIAATGRDSLVLFRSLCDLVIQVTSFMIAAELAQRCFVQLKKNLTQLFGFGVTGCETLPVNFSQRADKSVAVLVADFAVVVAVAIVESGFAHRALHYADSWKHPPVRTKWQPCAAAHRPAGAAIPVVFLWMTNAIAIS
jgi:hypothetical protein